MDAHLIDSAIYGGSWSTEESRRIFAERARLTRWVEILGALARAQAGLGMIPAESAAEITAIDADALDIAAIARGTTETAHSTLGLIGELQRHLSPTAGQHVYLGTTVQDITDTALSLEMAAVGDAVWDDLRHIERSLSDLAETHRSSPMIGRTHGQPGAPITFGFKVASWVDELGRSLERMREIAPRCLVAQLGGAVGSLAFFGDDALALRAAFAREVGLGLADTSWLTARDRLTEFASTLTLATAALARTANEVFVLQRAEIGEVREATTATTVGSITMPHKRNPERSEQVVALARLVRAQATSLAETMVQEHERDARGWKAEWVTFPTLAHYACAATSLSRALVDGLEVDTAAMLANVSGAGTLASEQLLRSMTERVGKHEAQHLLNAAYGRARQNGTTVAEELGDAATASELAALDGVDTGACAALTDRVVAVARTRQSAGAPSWR